MKNMLCVQFCDAVADVMPPPPPFSGSNRQARQVPELDLLHMLEVKNPEAKRARPY